MHQIILKRVLWMFPILLAIHFLTFSLFFVVNSPDDIARSHLGAKYYTKTDIERWKRQHGFDKPLFHNPKLKGIKAYQHTLFYEQTLRLFRFDFGLSLDGTPINQEIKNRVGPSLSIALPAFVIGITVNLLVALLLVFFRNTHLNHLGLFISVCFLSVSTLFYIIFSQHFIAFSWNWAPISGYEPGVAMIPFIILPIVVHVLAGLGSGSRWYRTFLMEEIEQPYINTARANGLLEYKILCVYALRNALLPIVTGIVVIIPTLFLGSLLFESFFSIPGLGNYLIDALHHEDFTIVQAMVFLGSLAYLLGLLLTDLVYGLIDPRVRLQ